jgi:hypothetical protein
MITGAPHWTASSTIRLTAWLSCLVVSGALASASEPADDEDVFTDLPGVTAELDDGAATSPGTVPGLETAEPKNFPQSSLSMVPPWFRPTTPAARMTIRRDPDPHHQITDESGIGKSIALVQLELDEERSLALDELATSAPCRNNALFLGNESPYGKYIFLMHDPLLFEDIGAERYGEYHPGVQPVISFTKFVCAMPFLPYKIAANYYGAKYDHVYTAVDHHGNLRPGLVEGAYFPDYYLGAPYPNTRFCASLVQLGTVAGIVLFLP